jgi:hypothetical protein
MTGDVDTSAQGEAHLQRPLFPRSRQMCLSGKPSVSLAWHRFNAHTPKKCDHFGMAEEPPLRRRRARHELVLSGAARVAARKRVLVSVLLGVSWAVACVAAWVIGVIVTADLAGAARPGRTFWQGSGALGVGTGCLLLATAMGNQIFIRRYGRRHPRFYNQPSRFLNNQTISQALRFNRSIVILLVVVIVLCLWLSHQYG